MTTDPLAGFLAHMSLAGLRPRTVAARARTLRTFADTIAPRGLLLATRADASAFIGRPGLAAESRRAYRSHLRAFYAWCVDEELVEVDPMTRIPPVRVPRKMPRPISGPDLDRALALGDARMRAWLLLMALAGLRCIEVSGLRPVDLTTTDDGTLLYLRECKGGGSATVPAHPAILDALSSLPIRNGLWWSIQPDNIGVAVSAHLRGCGVNATAHQLRHFAGTAWYRASGHDLLTTARLLRHASVNTTQVYAGLDPTRPAEVVNAVPLRLVDTR